MDGCVEVGLMEDFNSAARVTPLTFSREHFGKKNILFSTSYVTDWVKSLGTLRRMLHILPSTLKVEKKTVISEN